MKRRSGIKRFASLLLSVTLVVANIGTSVNTVYGSDGDFVDFVISGVDFTSSIEAMIEQGREPVTPDDLCFTDGEIEKYDTLFFGEDAGWAIYEFYPEFEGEDLDAQVRSFIRLPQQLDEGYTLTGEEKIIFLYMNNGESTLRCSVTIAMSEGKDKRTKRVKVRSYEDAYGDEEQEIITPVKDRVDESQPLESADGSVGEQPQEDTTAKETAEAESSQPSEEGVTGEAETSASEVNETTDAAESEERTEAEKETSEAETEAQETEERETELKEDAAADAPLPQAGRSRNNVPLVASSQLEILSEESQPEERQPEESQPAESQPEESQPAESQPEESQPAESQPEESQPAESQPAESQPAESQPEESQPAESQPAESQPEESQPAESQPEESQPAESQPEESQPAESQPEESQPAESQPEESQPVNTATSSDADQPQKEPEAAKVPAATDADLVGIDGCSTAKAYTTTLDQLKVLDDLEGYKITYEISPPLGACIVDGVNKAQEGESITFGVKAFPGYVLEGVSVKNETLETEAVDGDTAWYTLPEISESQRVVITMTETTEHPPFRQVIYMEDGMEITISAGAGILPFGVEATAERVIAEEGLVKAAVSQEGAVVTAAPVYDINLWFNGEKLDNEVWNENARVDVAFSGTMMEEISRNSDQLQVVWVKDDEESRSKVPEAMVEMVQGTKVELEQGEILKELSWPADHFTKYSPVGIILTKAGNKSFQIEDLLYNGQPQVEFLDAAGVVLPVTIDPDTHTVRLANGAPLPRNIQFQITMVYGLENSQVDAERIYAVQPGDTFTYRYPSNLKFNIPEFDVKDGNEVIGKGIIENGLLTITITKVNIGLNFKGSVGVYGSVDWEEVGREEQTVVVKVGDIEYILEFEPAVIVEKYNAVVKKNCNDQPYDIDNENDPAKRGDVRYHPDTGLPSAVRFHITVEADKDNSGALVFSRDGMYLHDTFSSTYTNKAYFDLNSLKITENNMSEDPANTVDSASFYPFREGSNVERIYLKDKDGNYASLLPGQRVTLSYWLILSDEVWENSITGDAAKDYAATSMKLDNTIRVRLNDENIAQDTFTFTKLYQWFMKSGEVVYYEHPDGRKEPAVRYYVFLNPNGIDLGRWTVKDTVDISQEYLGSVDVYAFENEKAFGGTSSMEEKDKVGKAAVDGLTWSYTIPEDRGTAYYVFEYYTKVTEPTDKALELANKVELIAPNGTEVGSGGIVIPYYTFSLTKENKTTRMIGKTPVLGLTWDSFGEIRWKTVISGYNRGEETGAFILPGSRYTDQLSIIGKGNSEELDQFLKYHTFNDGDSNTSPEKDINLIITDGHGQRIPEEDYTLAVAKGQNPRRFTIQFEKEAAAPVTLEYSSHVTDFTQFGDTELLFKNEAAFEWGGAQWTADAYHPYSRGYYLDKEVERVDSNTGIVDWKLIVNDGYNQWVRPVIGNHQVDIVENIPEGMELVDISYNGTLLTLGTGAGAEYEQEGRRVTIHLNNINGFDFANTQTLSVRTRIADPSKSNGTFENKATMVINGIDLSEAAADVKINNAFLEKGMEYNAQTAPTVKYTLLINKGGAKISSLPGGTLEVKDRLGSDKMSYVSLDTKFKVTDGRNGAPIIQAQRTMDPDGRGFTVTNLPDETPIIISYEVALSGNVGDEVWAENSAELRYSYEETIKAGHEERVIIIKPVATGEGIPYIVIHKEDQDGNPLEGAEFTLYKVVKDGGVWKTSDVVGIYRPAGAMAEAFLQDLEAGQIYYLEETKAPEGYTGAAGMYFAIPGNTPITDYPQGTMLCYAGFDYTFINVKDRFFDAEKVLTGRTLRDNEFIFDVYEGDRLITTGRNRADGSIVFEDIVYEESDIGIHEYKVQERSGSLSFVTYDRTVYTVKVQVAMSGGRIYGEVISIEYENGNAADGIVFNNVYDPPGGGGGDSGGGGGGRSSRVYTSIPEADVPLASGTNISLLDEEVPLAGLPKTGERRSSYSLMALFGSVLAGIYMAIHKRKSE